MRSGKRRLAILLGVTSIGVLAMVGPAIYEELWIEWRTRAWLREVRAVATPAGIEQKLEMEPALPESAAIVALGEEGFPIIARGLDRAETAATIVCLNESVLRSSADRLAVDVAPLGKCRQEVLWRGLVLA